MNTDVKISPLNEVCTEIIDCVNKTAPVVDYKTPYKMLRTTNVKKGYVDVDSVRYVSEETYKKWTRRAKPKRNDIILTREAPLGEIGLLRSDDNVFLGQRLIQYRANQEVLDQLYLYYAFQDSFVQSQIRSYGSGSTVEHLRIGDCETIKVKYPSLSTQKKIASILSAYDDLIENNNKRIKLLEEMAEGIYKEWFVRMRFPGYKKAVKNNGVPEGWHLKKFSETVNRNPKHGLKKSETYSFVEMAGLSESNFTVEKTEPRAGVSGSEFMNGDVLFSRITPCLQNGKTGYVSCLNEKEVAKGSTEFIVFRGGLVSSEYVYFLSRQDSFRKHAENSMAGASGRQRVDSACFDSYYILVPPKRIMEDFSSYAKTNFELATSLHQKNNVLKETRDLLLPRLISGKLSVEHLAVPEMEDVAEPIGGQVLIEETAVK